MITPGQLDNRMADPKGSEAVEADLRRVKGRTKPEEEFAARLRAARAVPLLRAPDLHCAHCFGEGREAAIRAFEAPVDGP